MAIRKNVKRIDPRYFLDETTHRGEEDRIDESQWQDNIDADAKCAKKYKRNSPEYEKCLDEQGIAENLDEGGCGDHGYDETEMTVIDDEEVAVTPQDTAQGLANELLAIAQRIAGMLGQEASVSSLPDEEDEFMMEKKDDNWIQDAEKDIERRGTEGVCTGKNFGSEKCPPGSKRYNLAKTFRKMAKDRKKK